MTLGMVPFYLSKNDEIESDLSSAEQNGKWIDVSNWPNASDLIADILRKDAFPVEDAFNISYYSETVFGYRIQFYQSAEGVPKFKVGKMNWKLVKGDYRECKDKVQIAGGSDYNVELLYYNSYNEETKKQ